MVINFNFWDFSFYRTHLTGGSKHWLGPGTATTALCFPPHWSYKSNFQIDFPNKSKLVSNTKLYVSHRPEQLSESTGKRVLLRRLVGSEKSVPGILKRIHVTGGCELRSLFRMKPKVRHKKSRRKKTETYCLEDSRKALIFSSSVIWLTVLLRASFSLESKAKHQLPGLKLQNISCSP